MLRKTTKTSILNRVISFLFHPKKSLEVSWEIYLNRTLLLK